MAMTKKDYIAKIAEKMDITKKDTAEIVNATAEVIKEALLEDGEVTIPGVGKLVVKERNCRNPQTGEALVAKTISFKACSDVKTSVKEQ